MSITGYPKHSKDILKYSKYRWWLGMPLGDFIDRDADVFPNKEAVSTIRCG
jgi:hypothetical protein